MEIEGISMVNRDLDGIPSGTEIEIVNAVLLA